MSPIAFGAFKIGRNEGAKYPSRYALPDEQAVAGLLNGVLDLGINCIDTAPAYGLSEERIGAALSRRRDEFVLCTKVGETFEQGRSAFDFSSAAVKASVTQSLKRLRTDRLDVVFVHSSGEDRRIIEQTEVVATLQGLRAAGAIRALGFSGKTAAGARAALAWADVLMIEYHVQDTSHEPVIAEAAAREVGIVVKKGLGSGWLDPVQAIPFVLRRGGITSMVIGSLNLEHLRENIRCAETCSD